MTKPFAVSLNVLAFFRLFLMLGFIILCAPFQIVAQVFGLPLRDTLPQFFHHVLMNYILGIKISVSGVICRDRPTLYLCNHLSYLDIPALGAVLRARFVSKAEVANWPLFGFLAKLQNTVFVERRGKLVQKQGNILKRQLDSKNSLVLFPEGTSTDGTTPPRPFKSSLLQAVIDDNAKAFSIQPVSIACYGKDGRAAFYPWYGDMTLVPHLWKIYGINGLSVNLTFHPPFSSKQFADRKALAFAAYDAVAKGPVGAREAPVKAH